MSTGSSRTARLAGLLSITVFALSLSPGAALAQESASYVMERMTITSTANLASSTSYEMTLTFGQEGPVGSVSVCSMGAFQSTGFWSIVADPPVPIILDARQDPGDPSAVELSWTGAAGLFEVFRSEMADTVSQPATSLGTTSGCILSDAPPSGSIFYYLVDAAGLDL